MESAFTADAAVHAVMDGPAPAVDPCKIFAVLPIAMLTCPAEPALSCKPKSVAVECALVAVGTTIKALKDSQQTGKYTLNISYWEQVERELDML